MAEYIDIDKTIIVTDTQGRELKTTVRHILDINQGAYDVDDVQPVRHGRWILKAGENWYGGGGYECSACKYGYAIGAYHEPDEFTYCPNCGAKMDGGKT